ncbi:hypothetical protein ACWKWZ_18225 [Metapseudomonas otitidis]
MKKVGFIFIEAVLSPLCDPQEPLYSDLLDVDGEDDLQLRKVVREIVRPYYDSFDARSKDVISDSILYFAFVDKFPEFVCFDALPIPFDLPRDSRKFCMLLLEELEIKKEGFDLRSCEYSDDVKLVHRLRRNNKV